MPVFFFLAFTMVSSLSFAQNCQPPSAQQLRQFFGNNQEWTEVDARNPQQMETRNTIEIFLNFSSPLQTQVLRNGRPFAQAGQICSFLNNGADPHILLVARGYEIVIRSHGGMISSTMSLPIVGERTYYYRPSHLVDRIERTSELEVDTAFEQSSTI